MNWFVFEEVFWQISNFLEIFYIEVDEKIFWVVEIYYLMNWFVIEEVFWQISNFWRLIYRDFSFVKFFLGKFIYGYWLKNFLKFSLVWFIRFLYYSPLSPLLSPQASPGHLLVPTDRAQAVLLPHWVVVSFGYISHVSFYRKIFSHKMYLLPSHLDLRQISQCALFRVLPIKSQTYRLLHKRIVQRPTERLSGQSSVPVPQRRRRRRCSGQTITLMSDDHTVDDQMYSCDWP